MRNKGIIIELTALLDIILILMFLVLTRSGQQVTLARQAITRSDAAIEALAAENNALQAENDRLQRLNDGYAAAADNSLILSLSVQPTEMDERIIMLETSVGVATTIPLNWDNRQYAANRLRAVLAEQLREMEKQVIFVIFSYDRNTIYHSDYSLITNAIQQMKRDARVFTAEYDVSAVH